MSYLASVVQRADDDGPKRSPAIFLARFLLLCAIVIACYLAYTAVVAGKLAGCGGGSCSEVLQSKWSSVLGLPVGALGALLYGLVWWQARRVRFSSDLLARILAWSVLLGAAWFVVVQAVILRSFCPWCCTAHALAVSAVAVLWWGGRSISGHRGVAGSWQAPLAGLAGVSALAMVQYLSPEPQSHASSTVAQATTEVKGGQPTAVKLHGGEFSFSLGEYPATGPLDAKHVLVAITDYACGHCRHLHDDLIKVIAEHENSSLAVLWLPGMKNDNSAEVQRVMLALWKRDKALHAQMEKDIFSGALEPKPEPVKEAVAKLLGGKPALEAMIAADGAWAHAMVYRAFQLFEKTGETSGKKLMPMLLAGSQVLVGAVKNPLIYHQVIEKEMGLKVPADLQAALVAATQNVAPPVAAVATVKPAEPEKEKASDGTLNVPGFSESSAVLTWHGSYPVETQSVPRLTGGGAGEGKRPLVLLMDFLSAESRTIAAELRDPARTGGASVLLLPAMPTGEAQTAHRALLALWKADPKLWSTVVEGLLKPEAKPTAESITAEVAKAMGGAEKLSAASAAHQAWLQKTLVATHRIYLANNKLLPAPMVPQLLAGPRLITGKLPSAAELASAYASASAAITSAH